MAKKKSKTADFNMSEAIREILTENPKVSCKEASAAVMAKHPTAKINDSSFMVAFYTSRKKLGIGSSRGKKGVKKSAKPAARKAVDLAMLQAAAKFLSEVGGADAALEAIKQVQAVQVK